MQTLFALILVLVGPYFLSSAQIIRPSCNLTNCSRINREICTTNGQQCRRFSNECSLESVNCNATLATVWNRTDAVQCVNLSVNATGVCSCPSLRTCSNRTVTAGICVHRDGHACRLFRSECDLIRARCNREVWRNIDIMQCRSLSFNQTGTCTCPKSLICSRNETQLCVQINANTCRLYNNECDLEGDRCRGQRLLDINNLHCQRFQIGLNATCTCPNLLTCQRNITNICIRNAANRCQLMRNQCDLERGRCEGNVLTPTLAAQCRNIRPGQTGNCGCPGLATCSVNRTNICVRTRVGCRLKTNECELERARCLGEVATPVSSVQCRGFLPGDGRPCTCPRLFSCNSDNTNICIRSAQGCTLLRNECAVEAARCEGLNFTIVDAIQCRNFSLNQLQNCSCPAMGICTSESANLCVETSATRCKLVRNRCELEKARCQGETLSITNSLQCRGFPLNVTSNCFCPRFRNCSQSVSNICVRENDNNNTCMLLRNECELEQAICEGRDVTRVDRIHCRNFTNNISTRCFCRNLTTCNRNSSSICAMSSTQCRLFRNECEFEQAKCEGSRFRAAHASHCLNFNINQQNNCSCLNLLTCSQNSTRICVRTRVGCKLLTTQCELEEALCRGEALNTVESIHCRGFRNNETNACFCPNLATCSRNTSNICVKNLMNNCTLLNNQCDLEMARCQGQALTILPNLHCSNFPLNTTRNCSCSNMFNCSTNATSTCLKLASGNCKLLRNQCEVEHEKCQGPAQTISLLNCMGFVFNQTGNCSCPNLKTCSRNNTNICVKTNTGCRLMTNECQLEQLRCQGQNLTVLPAIQCRYLQAGNEGVCACPNWLSCQRNSSNVCTQMQQGCKLLRNHCELEQALCQGEALNVTNILQCQGFAVDQLRNCACPDLKTCSQNNSNPICVRNQQNCTLMRNSCDFEMAKCEGEKWCSANIEECTNFTVGQQATCTCPQLQTCSQSNDTSICVNLRGACQLMANACELEKAKCRGQAWMPTNEIQCQNYIPNQWRWCACPRLFNCCNRENIFCVRGPSGCKLMKTDCDLQLARCRGEVWTRTDDLQCAGFELNQNIRNCSCPKLATCEATSELLNSTEVCVRNRRGCKLLRNDCELQRLLCSGEAWQSVDNLQCLNFTLYQTRSCRCPALDFCSNTTSVCGKGARNQCYHFKTECDMRWAQCEGENYSLTLPRRCQGLRVDEHDECKCPESRNCNRQRQICGRKEGTCKLFGNECDFRNSTCQDENWQPTSLGYCCQFRINNIQTCTSNMTSSVCVEVANNRCRLFATRCDLEIADRNNVWPEVDSSKCKCIRSGRTGSCAERVTCNPTNNRSRRVCGRQGLTHRMFTSRCHLRMHNYQNCTNFREVRAVQCRIRPG